MTSSVTFRATLVAVLGLALALLGLAPAQAHSDTFQSVPVAGSTSASVSQIQFTFAEPVQKTMSPEVVLSASGGVNVPVSAPTFDVTGATMTVGIPSGALPNGVYAAVYRVVSIDGHVATGVLNFTVAGSSAAPLAGTSTITTPEPTLTASPSGTDGILSAFLPLVISIVALLPLFALAVVIIVLARKRGR